MIFENENPNKPVDFYERKSAGADDRRRSRIVNPTPYSGLGKLPPQATDLEEVVLGALMLERSAYLDVSDFLSVDCFYKDNHQKIYLAIQKLFHKGEPIDILKVTAELRLSGELEMIGGAYYITELTNRVASAANIEFHARIIYQKYLQREMIRLSSEIIQHAYEDTTDVLELIQWNQVQLMKISNFEDGKKSEHIETLLAAGIKEIDKPATNGLTGVGTGFKCVNDFTSGWQKADLTILAARPAMGKSALMMQFVRDASVLYNVPTAVFSLEMSSAQLIKRMIANETDIFLEKINKKTLTEFDRQSLDGKLHALKNAPLYIDDTAGLTTVSFRAKCIRLKKLFNIQFVAVDYLQLMQGISSDGRKNGNRDQEIGEITRTLKKVAKELDISVLALSQLSRNSESRPGASKRPQLQDLRESGNIEQDADNVIFLFRPEYYGLTVDEHNNSTAQMAEVIYAKHRMGETGSLYLKWIGSVMRFETWVTQSIYVPGESDKEENSVENKQLNAFAGLVKVPNNGDPDEEAPF